MNTEDQFMQWYADKYPHHNPEIWTHIAAMANKLEGWRAAQKNQEAIVKATLEAAAEALEDRVSPNDAMDEQEERLYETLTISASIIRDLDVQQILKNVK